MRKIYSLIVLSLFGIQAFSQSIPEFCLENDAAHRYLNDFVYDSNDYTYTRIYDYCDPYPLYNVVDYRKDQPLPAVAKLTNTFSGTGILYVSENEEFTDSTVVAVSGPVDSVLVYNLIPGRTYNWKLEYDNSGVKTVFQSGQFKTTGHLRMLKIDGLFNVRDLGGWTGLGGHKLRYGVLFRGSRMTNNGNSSSKLITAAGIQQMLDAGIKADLDLRTADERQLSSSPLGPTVSYSYENNSYASRISTFANDPASISGIQKIINWLKGNKPVYFHCSIGADRTGTIAYLIGALCGMSEDELSKEYELTCFSPDYVITNGRVEDLRRERTYHGRYDNSEESYKFALMVEKIKQFPGETLQQKVYYHLNTGAKPGGGNVGKSISSADLDWLIKYMVDYVMVSDIKTIDYDIILELPYGESKNLEATVLPANASETAITYVSADTNIVKVSADGRLTAVGRGDTKVTLKCGTYVKSIPVKVPVKENCTPATVQFNGTQYNVKEGTGKITDGSFEYITLYNWKSAANKTLSNEYFEIKKYAQDADSVYLESKADGDSKSEASIRAEWVVTKNKTYVFGYRVKNSTNKVTTSNANLKAFLIKSTLGDDDASAFIFEAPSYDGNWTEVQYVFTPTVNRLRIVFTHLSQDGNNTCFDNFYLAELDVPSGTNAVEPIIEPAKPADDRIFNLSGQEVVNPGKGVYIRNGKKYIIK